MQLFNYLIHAGTNWVSDKNQPDDEKRNKLKKDCSPTDSKVIVQNGELLAGIICKKAVCPAPLVLAMAGIPVAGNRLCCAEMSDACV